MRIKIEPRLTSTWKLSAVIPLFSLAAALFSGGVFLFFMGVSFLFLALHIRIFFSQRGLPIEQPPEVSD